MRQPSRCFEPLQDRSTIVIGMLEKRKFPRYDVENYPQLQGTFASHRNHDRLHTIGLGGCGFYGLSTEPVLELKTELKCVFEWKEVLSSAIEVNGILVYAPRVEVKGKNLFYYGIEFLESERERLHPIISKLEEFAGNQGIFRTSYVREKPIPSK